MMVHMLRRFNPKWTVGSALVLLAAVNIVVLAQTAPDEKVAPKPAARPASQAAAPPTADEVLGKMLKPRPQGQERELTINEPPAVDRTSGDGAIKPHAPVVTVMREGTPLVNRVGRITLTSGTGGSHAEFTFDADGQALRDPPLIILPNLKLMAMEDAVRAASRDLRFRVSGIVTEYRGRNYLLLEKVTVVQDVVQQLK